MIVIHSQLRWILKSPLLLKNCYTASSASLSVTPVLSSSLFFIIVILFQVNPFYFSSFLSLTKTKTNMANMILFCSFFFGKKTVTSFYVGCCTALFNICLFSFIPSLRNKCYAPPFAVIKLKNCEIASKVTQRISKADALLRLQLQQKKHKYRK